MKGGRNLGAAKRLAPLTSLTGEQANWLRRARDAPNGEYVPTGGGAEPARLVDSGLAKFREVRQTSETLSLSGRPCEWSDFYLLPTRDGLAMLRKFDR
jgi:hypothetical protein